MEKILTKNEIEALLNAVFEGRIEPEKELSKAEGAVANYDLVNADAHKGYVPNLDIIYDSFIRYNRVNLSNRLRKSIEIKKVGARSYKFDDFLQTLPTPVCMGIFKIEPLKGAALVSFDSTLVLSLVDSLLGGTGSAKVSTANRMFTSIELRIMEKIVGDALLDLEKAWAPLYATHMSLLRMETNPRLLNIVPPEYQIVTMTLKIQIDDISGNIMFAVPFMTIDPIREKLKTGMQFDLMAIDPQWSNRLSAEIMEAPMEASVEMGNARISLRELLDLSPGDTIMLDSACSSEMVVKIEGVPKYFGVPGITHGNKAIQISKICSNRG
ncbi:MAG: flagellar motor switch protein FliM [Desulfuromonadaceae bacterium]|nr:flagellar motor switch protein FliM [Desulfuromonadaceae bacterium]MDD5104030.1 flagellar motor switch protein FliM [Desulfuromonadaceae bacterium]